MQGKQESFYVVLTGSPTNQTWGQKLDKFPKHCITKREAQQSVTFLSKYNVQARILTQAEYEEWDAGVHGLDVLFAL